MKRFIKRIATLGFASLVLFSGLTSLQAQPSKRFSKDCPRAIQLSDQQKEQMKEIRLDFAKATTGVNNELNELRAHQRTLMSAQNPQKIEIYANLDKMSSLQKQLMKERLSMKLKMQSFFTEEQRLLCQNRPFGKQGMHSGRKGDRGQGQYWNSLSGDDQKAGFGANRNGKGVGRGQRNMDCVNGCGNGLNLSDEQKKQMDDLRLTHMNATQELRNEAEELRLKQKHLMTTASPDEKLIMENVDRLSDIQNKLAKMKVDHQMEVRKVLNVDQLTLFLSRPGMGKGICKGCR